MSVAVRPDEMPSRAGWNSFAGRIWPAGRSLETPALKVELQSSVAYRFTCLGIGLLI